MYWLRWIFLSWFMGQNLGEELQFGKEISDMEKVTEGQSIFLNCFIQNLQPERHIVVWKRDNTLLTEGTEVSRTLNDAEQHRISLTHIESVQQYLLIIEPARRSDANYKYTCGVFSRDDNQYNKPLLNSKPITLLVQEIPSNEYPSCSSGRTSYIEGSIMVLTCITEEVSPTVNIVWYNYNKSLLTTRNNIKTLELRVNATDDMNSQQFTCGLSSSVVELRNCTITVDVRYAPKVNINGPKLIQMEKEEVYVCFPHANPQDNLKFSWEIQPTINKHEYHIVNSDQVLRLKRTSKSPNEITLICTVRNSIGQSTAKLSVRIEDDSLRRVTPADNKNMGSMEGPEVQEKTGQKFTKSFDSTLVLSIIGSCLLITAILIALALCYFQLCKMQRHSLNSLGHHIAQPEVYFVPKDSVRHTTSEGGRKQWKRTVGVQVPSDLDKDSVYAEIEDGKKVLVNTQSISV